MGHIKWIFVLSFISRLKEPVIINFTHTYLLIYINILGL